MAISLHPERLTAGTLVGHCRITEQLGRGGGGIVYRAVQTALERDVALKVLAPAQVRRGKNYVKRFLQEARLAASLHHRNIVEVYDAGVHEGLYYIVMEYVEGTSLDRLVQNGEQTDLAYWLPIMEQVCHALIESHSKGIVHRDIKPANMLLDSSNSVKLADFGLAVWAEGQVNASQDVAGTPHYMPPEILESLGLDARSDIYSLGASFYHFLTGRFLFQGESPLMVILKHANDAAIPIQNYRPDLPPAICELIMAMLEKSPDNRPQSANEVLVKIQSSTTPATIVGEDYFLPPTIIEDIPADVSAPKDKEVVANRSAVFVGREGDLVGCRFSISLSRTTTIGRLRSNDISIEDPTISRRHCTVSLHDGEFVIKDLGSSNGCRINGKKVREGTITAGDAIHIGKRRFRFYVMAVSEDAYQLAEQLVKNKLLTPDDAKHALNELASGLKGTQQLTLGQILLRQKKVSKTDLDRSVQVLERTTRKKLSIKIGRIGSSGAPSAAGSTESPKSTATQKTSVVSPSGRYDLLTGKSDTGDSQQPIGAHPPPPRRGNPSRATTPSFFNDALPPAAPTNISQRAEVENTSKTQALQQLDSQMGDSSTNSSMNTASGADSLFGQMSICSGCKEIIMMSDIDKGEAVYVHSKLFCRRCGANKT